MIKVEELTKSYGMVQALRGVSFEVNEGEIVGLLGPNGAGKSTIIKILTGFLHQDAGSVTVDELDVLSNTLAVQSRIGYLSENTPLYPNLSVQAYLRLIADMRGIPVDSQRELLSDAIRVTGMVDHRARPISNLSKGLRQRVGLAQAILHRPRLLILDEPTVGLDPTQIVEIRHLIKRLAQDSTILFSSHILSEVEAICDRVVIIINGEVKADAHLDDLANTTDAVLVLGEDQKGIVDRLSALDGVERVETFQTTDGFPAYRVITDEDITPMLYDIARQENWSLRELRRDVMTLEMVFNQLAAAA
jgi:ABC-2 type transport system ATP-binding protein